MPLRFKGDSFEATIRFIVILGAFPFLAGLTQGGTPEAVHFTTQQIEFFQKQVQPILADNCFKCHSHQADKIKGSLVLDSRDGALKGGESGPAIVPGEPEQSLLVRAVRRVDEDLKMPPK